VRGREHRDRRVDRVDVQEGLAGLADAGQALGDDVRAEVAELEQDVVVVRSRAPASRTSVAMARDTTSRLARSLAFGA